jgi:hypothetical protein
MSVMLGFLWLPGAYVDRPLLAQSRPSDSQFFDIPNDRFEVIRDLFGFPNQSITRYHFRLMANLRNNEAAYALLGSN